MGHPCDYCPSLSRQRRGCVSVEAMHSGSGQSFPAGMAPPGLASHKVIQAMFTSGVQIPSLMHSVDALKFFQHKHRNSLCQTLDHTFSHEASIALFAHYAHCNALWFLWPSQQQGSGASRGSDLDLNPVQSPGEDLHDPTQVLSLLQFQVPHL